MQRMCTAIITGAFIFIGATAHGETIPEQIDINLQQSNPSLAGEWQDKKEVKGFNHLAHIKILEKASAKKDVCLTCHKEANNREEILADTRKDRQQEVVIAAGGIKKYMHNQCISCHKALKKQKETTGPTSCKGCH